MNNISIHHGDCIEIMDQLIEQGVQVDMVLTDMPYGTTHCAWDSVIDLPAMWQSVEALTNDRTPILLFGQEPFSTVLRASNLKMFRYDWIWEKSTATGHLNAKKMPMRAHEVVSVFYKKLPVYNPIKTTGHQRKISTAHHKRNTVLGRVYGDHSHTDYDSTERYPRTILKFATDKQTCNLHPTQKPVALLEYLIKTYTSEGDVVLDFTMGSGSTAIACLNTNRRFIGIEQDQYYFNIAEQRIQNHDQYL